MRLEKVNEAYTKGIQVVTAKELAAMLEIGTHQLAKMRSKQTGPSFLKKGKLIFYKLEDVIEWSSGGRSFTSTTEASAFKAGLLAKAQRVGRRAA